MTLDTLKTYWKESIAYRAEYYMSLVLNPLRFFALVMIWYFIYNANGITEIKGYELTGLITYFMISTIVYIITYNNIPENFQDEITKGDFIVNLLKPVYYPFIWLLKKIARRGFAFLIEVIPLFIIFALFFKKYFIIGDIGFFLVSVLFAFFISYLVSSLIACIAFWFINIRSLAWLLRFVISFSSGMFVPITLFPSFLEKILNFLPFKYLSYVPTNIYLGKFSKDIALPFVDTVYFQLIMQVVWIAILYLLLRFTWKRGVKKFAGVGA